MRKFHLLIGTGIIGVTLACGDLAGAQSVEPQTPLLMAQVMPGPEGTPAERRKPAAKQRTAIAPAPAGCLTPEQMPDKDGDFARHMDALRSPGLCLTYDVFEEGGIRWVLQIIKSQTSRSKIDPKDHVSTGPLWFLPHDDENAAFDTAIDRIQQYGGTIVAVESGGNRLNEGQDPNRNFDAGGDRKCPQQLARSPQYTKRVLQWWDRSQPIIALHSNRPTGSITIARSVPFSTSFRGKKAASVGGIDPDHTLVFVASRAAPDADPALKGFVDAMNVNGVNVIYETVASKHSDCSLSNYASLMHIRNYLNVEVITGDSPTQIKIVNVIMDLMKQRGPIPALEGAAAAAETGPTGSVPAANADDPEQPKPAKKPKKTAKAKKPVTPPDTMQ
jgi:hypothetical protein